MKTSAGLALGMAILLCLSGCAKTPNAPIVVQKNNDRLIEKAASADENRKPLQDTQEEVPKDYTFRYDGKIPISASADVILPDTNQISMYPCRCQGIPQEQVTAIYDYLFQGEATWYAKDNQYYTKSMAAEDLAAMRQELEALKADTTLPPDRKQNQMDTLQDMIQGNEDYYDLYPDEIVKLPTDSTYRTESYDSIYGPGEMQVLTARTDSGKLLSIQSYSHDYPNRFADSNLCYMSQTGDKYTSEPYAVENDPVPYGSDVPFSCTYSYEEAKALADGVFRAAGLDVRLVQTELLRGFREKTRFWASHREITYDDVHNAYLFCYSRVIDGIPVAVTTSDTMYVDDTNPCWLYERMYVTVDDGGIARVDWQYPVVCADPVNEDVNILPFADAARIFETMAPLIYEGKYAASETQHKADNRCAVVVEKVELDLMRTRDGGGLTGLYVPAWVFYGTEQFGFVDNHGVIGVDQYRSPWIILAVNAVDGSVIDVKAGY